MRIGHPALEQKSNAKPISLFYNKRGQKKIFFSPFFSEMGKSAIYSKKTGKMRYLPKFSSKARILSSLL